MNKKLLKGLYAFLLVSIALFAVILITAEAVEMGNYCWEVTHPQFDNGTPHVLILQQTQNRWINLLHGADNTSMVPVHGSSYKSPSLNRIGSETRGQTYLFTFGGTPAKMMHGKEGKDRV